MTKLTDKQKIIVLRETINYSESKGYDVVDIVNLKEILKG